MGKWMFLGVVYLAKYLSLPNNILGRRGCLLNLKLAAFDYGNPQCLQFIRHIPTI